MAAVAAPSAWKAGFSELAIPFAGEGPLQGGVWYPTSAPAAKRPLESFSQEVAAPGASVHGWNLPLVVISHGGGGSFAGHYDTAVALAQAGFVAAAITHRGDSYDDQSQVLKLWRRPVQLSRLIDFMLRSWEGRTHIDSRRIGAFGFSNGGFTVLVAAGGVADLRRIGAYCTTYPAHDLCRALHEAGTSPAQVTGFPISQWLADVRIRSLVVAAPAFGFTFGPSGLEGVHIPVQLWGAREDHHQPAPWYEDCRASRPPGATGVS